MELIEMTVAELRDYTLAPAHGVQTKTLQLYI